MCMVGFCQSSLSTRQQHLFVLLSIWMSSCQMILSFPFFSRVSCLFAIHDPHNNRDRLARALKQVYLLVEDSLSRSSLRSRRRYFLYRLRVGTREGKRRPFLLFSPRASTLLSRHATLLTLNVTLLPTLGGALHDETKMAVSETRSRVHFYVSMKRVRSRLRGTIFLPLLPPPPHFSIYMKFKIITSWSC